MNFEPYIAYKKLTEARQKAKNFQRLPFKKRILKLQRSKPNPKLGGWFISPNGIDDNNGRSYLTPIKDFRKIQLKPGDKVYFERGHIYNFAEYIVTVNNLTFGSYGSGADPKFYGADTLSGATWTSETGGYYSTPLATAPLWVANPSGEMARQGESNWIPVTAFNAGIPDERTFNDATLDAFHAVQSLVGCRARFKEFTFRMSYEYTINAYDGSGKLTFSDDVVGAAVDMPMKLYGQKQFATLEGDWWYDDANDKLWIKTASDPTGLDWRVVTENQAFLVNAASGVTIEGIEFTQYYRAAIESFQADTLSINSVNIHDIRTNGLWLYGNCDGISVDDYTIERCGMNAILVGAIQTASFTNGVVSEINRQLNIGWPIDTNFRKTGGDGFVVSDEAGEVNNLPGNCIISNFLYDQLGGHGISVYGNDWIISDGEIKNYALTFDDVGGFASFYRDDFGTGTTTGTITDVIVHDGIGNFEGIANYDGGLAVGFYIDNGSHAWTLNNCSAYNNSLAGVLANWNTEETTINGGLFGNNGTSTVGAQIIFHERPSVANSPNYLHNYKNVVDGVTMIPGSNEQRAILTTSYDTNADANYNPFTTGGSCDNNTYARIYMTVAVSLFGHSTNLTSSSSVTGVTFAGWQSRNSCDAASTNMSPYIDYTNVVNQAREVQFFPNPTGASDNQSIGVEFQDESGSDISDPIAVPAWSTRVGLRKASNYYLSDGFNGANGTTIAGRTPTIGPIPTILAGTHTIVTPNTLGSSVNGHVRWNLGAADFVLETQQKVTTLADGFLMNFRAADATTSANHRVVFTATSTTMTLSENNESGTPTTLQNVSFVPVTNTYYKWKFVFNGGSVIVYRDDVEVMNTTTNVVTGNYSGTFATTTKITEYITAYKV